MANIRGASVRPNLVATSEIEPLETYKDDQRFRKPGFLESIGCAVFSLARYTVEKVEKLPYPVGPFVDFAEELVSPKMIQISGVAESLALQALAYADEQVEWLLNSVDKCFQVVKEIMEASKPVLYKLVSATTDRVKGLESANSLVDYAANLLVNYEIVVKNQTNSVLHLVLSFSGLETFDNRGFATKDKFLPPVVVMDDRSFEAPNDNEKIMRLAESNKVEQQEISPVKKEDRDTANPRFRLAKLVASDGDEEADELSKLIDASWCLGSPRVK